MVEKAKIYWQKTILFLDKWTQVVLRFSSFLAALVQKIK